MKPYLFFLISSVAILAAACSESAPSCDDLLCDDANACTADSCDAVAVSCQHSPVSDGTSCTLDAGLAVCEAGVCVEDGRNDGGNDGFPEMGRVAIHLEFQGVAPAEVYLEASCAGWIMKAVFFPTDDGRWRLIGPLPSGTCEGQFVAADDSGEVLCTRETSFAMNPGSVTAFDEVVDCAAEAP